MYGRRQQRADNCVVAARFAYDGATQGVMPRLKVVPPLGHRGAAWLRPSVHHNARGFSLSV